MVAINLEAAYRLPISLQEGRWSVYVGAGPGLNFIHQGIGTRDISFSNFNYETGMNVFGGVRFRHGTFTEVKTSVWGTRRSDIATVVRLHPLNRNQGTKY